MILGDKGISSNEFIENKIIIDHSTVDVATSKQCFYELNKKGASFLDAPISGGPIGARDGTLSIMVGGNDLAFKKAKPFFEMMGKTIKKMGDSGTGTAMKLINQLLTAVHTTASAEALALSNAAKVNIDSAMEILMVSFGYSKMLERSAPIIRDRDFKDSSVPARNIHKDISIIEKMGKELSVGLPLTKVTKKLYDELKSKGKEMDDMAGIIQIIEEK